MLLPFEILEHDTADLVTQAKAANCIKVLSIGTTGEQLTRLVSRVNGVPILLRTGRKYCKSQPVLVIEVLGALANLFFNAPLRDQVFGVDRPEVSHNMVRCFFQRSRYKGPGLRGGQAGSMAHNMVGDGAVWSSSPFGCIIVCQESSSRNARRGGSGGWGGSVGGEVGDCWLWIVSSPHSVEGG